MEGLRKLEEMQRIVMMLNLHGVISPHLDPDSVRFLSYFTLFMLQPCGELNIDKKCHLISEHLSKISDAILKEAPLWHPVEDISPLKTDFEDIAMVGLDAMQRANSTLEDFCRSYFMFHEMDVSRPKSIFRYLPMLSFTESYIYQLDNLNEKMLYIPSNGATGIEQRSASEVNRSLVKFMEVFETNPFRPLLLLLERCGILSDRIMEELRCGEEYWALERKLCCTMISKEEASIDDAMRAIHLKSFDFRVLNLLLYQMRGQQVNELHMEFLSVSEFLVEVSDDLFDYEDDVIENNFNILRMFVRVYGASAAPTMLAKCITEAEEKYQKLLKTLDPQLSLDYHRRCEEATKEGGRTTGPSLGTWNIPPVIADESLYRSNVSMSKSLEIPLDHKLI